MHGRYYLILLHTFKFTVLFTHPINVSMLPLNNFGKSSNLNLFIYGSCEFSFLLILCKGTFHFIILCEHDFIGTLSWSNNSHTCIVDNEFQLIVILKQWYAPIFFGVFWFDFTSNIIGRNVVVQVAEISGPDDIQGLCAVEYLLFLEIGYAEFLMVCQKDKQKQTNKQTNKKTNKKQI
jgi:hypothetical protein